MFKNQNGQSLILVDISKRMITNINEEKFNSSGNKKNNFPQNQKRTANLNL